MPSHIVENIEDLKAVLEMFDQVEVVEGNKVSKQGSISVPSEYAGQRPLLAIFPNGDDQ